MAQPDDILVQLRRLARPSRLPNMARFGIDTAAALGVSIPDVRRVARPHRGDHALALALWATGIHEARILASLVDDPRQVTASQMNAWALDFRSWDLCDQVCNNLFNRTPHAWHTARTWSMRQEEFVRRAGFVLIATLAVHDKAATDDHFTPYFELIRRGSVDERHLVKKPSVGPSAKSANATPRCTHAPLPRPATSTRWKAKRPAGSRKTRCEN